MTAFSVLFAKLVSILCQMEEPLEAKTRTALAFIERETSDGIQKLFGHVSTTFQWIMGTLFAANAGAIVAILTSEIAVDERVRIALECFSAGMVFSVLIGMTSAFVGLIMSKRLQDLRGYVVTCLIEDSVDASSLHAKLQRNKMPWWAWSPSVIGIASLGLAIAGMTTVSSSAFVKKPDRPAELSARNPPLHSAK